MRRLQSLNAKIEDNPFEFSAPQPSGWVEFIRASRHVRSFIQKKVDLNKSNIANIREHRLTKRINYEDYPAPFDYVHSLYPNVGIKSAMVFYSPSSVLLTFGFSGVAGFYDIDSRIVVITDCLDSYQSDYKAEFTTDEVLCHELIHYAANFKQPVSRRELEEEIAYGYSIKYLQNKGRTDDFIIRKNLFPYLVTVVDRAKVYQKVLTSLYSPSALSKSSEEGLKLIVYQERKAIKNGIEEEAYSVGLNMINLYGKNKRDDSVGKTSKVNIDIDSEF